jgi:hypothetical protein
MSSTDERDPLDEARVRAREQPKENRSPVEGEEVTTEGDGDDATAPSLGAPPRRDESRPLFRSSQLQGDDERPDDAPPLRG